jgi:phosphoserine aminotransferase
VDILTFESFGAGWATDILRQLKLPEARVLPADYGDLPNLAEVDPAHDFVFTWNGTTSGVRVPNADWIAADRQGLAICDATSAVFAMPIEWEKLDVATWSWQKVLGGEAAHGMLALSPRAVARLESQEPAWPMPKVFRLTNKGKLTEGIFRGDTMNTPSMLCVEDALDGLRWAERIGGLPALFARSEANLKAVADFVERNERFDFLARDPATRSNTSICLKIVSPWFLSLDDNRRTAAAKRMTALLDERGIAHDIGSYRDAPPGLRIWGGATVETSDVQALMPWLQWAHDVVSGK